MTIDPREAGLVTSTLEDGVATISFGHPKSNSLPGALLGQLAAAVRQAGEDRAARVIVLRSEGTGAFCGGASFDELRGISDAAAGKVFFSGFANVILAMIRAPKFVLVRAHGKAAGGGVGLIAAADWAIASSGALLKLSELAVGIGAFVVGPVIERKVGMGDYAAMSVDADWRSAAWGAQHGLYADVRDSVEDMDATLTRRARWLAGCNPEAMRHLKQVFWAGTDGWDALLAERAAMSGTLVLSDETRAAIARVGA